MKAATEHTSMKTTRKLIPSLARVSLGTLFALAGMANAFGDPMPSVSTASAHVNAPVATDARDSAHNELVPPLPLLSASIPANNARDVPLGSPLRLRFAQPVKELSAFAGAFTLVGPTGSVPLNTAVAGSDVTLSPSEDLLPGTKYTLFISRSTASASDGSLQAVAFKTAILGTRLAHDESTDHAGLDGPDSPSSTSHIATGATARIDRSCESTHEIHGYRFCHEDGSTRDGIFVPGFNNTDGRWRTNIPLPKIPAAADFPRGTFLSGATAVFGVVRRIDDQPLSGVTVSIGKEKVRTDALGRFALKNVPDGHQVLFIDGGSANHGAEEYGQFEAAVDLTADQANAVPFNLYVPRITARDKAVISSPTLSDTTLTHPGIPGFEVHIPKGTVLRDRNGKVITQLSIVPMPVDRSPTPVPANFLVYVSLQPGEALVEGLTMSSSAGIQTVYPNYSNGKSSSGLWYYDAEGDGWSRYTESRATADEKHVTGMSDWGAKRLMPKGGPPSTGSDKKPSTNPPVDGTRCADPVDCASGDFLHTSTDLIIDDVSPVAFTRSYNSSDTYSHDFGQGMSHTYGLYLYSPDATCLNTGNMPATELDLIDSDGAVYPFFAPAGAPYLFNIAGNVLVHLGSPSRFYGAIMHLEVGSNLIYVELRDGTILVFTGCPSQLVYMTDRFGNMTTLSYVAGLLSGINLSSGRSLSFNHNSNNFISKVTDNAGRTVNYAYNAAKQLQSATYMDGTSEQYTYDTNGRMTSVIDRRGNTRMTNVYDTNGRVHTQTYFDGTFFQFDYTLGGNGKVTTTDATNERGYVTHMVFDAAGYTTAVTHAYGTALAQTTTRVRGQNELVTSTTDPLGRTTTMTYDSVGDVLTKTFLSGTPNAVTYTYTYTPDYHQIASVTDPLNHTTTYGYTNGCLTSITDALNHTTSILCNSSGQPLSITDALNHTTTLSYSGVDLRSVTDPLSHTTTFNTDNLGRVISTIDPLGRETRNVYDSNGRVVQTVDALNQSTTYVYDGNGNLTSVTDPAGGITQYGYDPRDRKTSRTDAVNHGEGWTYDGAGNVLTYTDRKSQLTQYQYDALGRLSLTTYADASTITPTYDAGNRTTSIVDTVSGTIGRSYDGLDRLTQEQTPQGIVNYTYDNAGRRATMTPASQAQISYTFDNADRLTNIVQGAQTVSIGYDNADHRTTLTLPNGVVTTYGYDNGDELTGITYQTSGGSTLASLTYGYDAAGQRTSRTGGFGADLLATSTTGTNTFDLANKQTLWNSSILGYDLNGDPTSNAATAPATTYTFDARHRLTQMQQGSTTLASFAYDAFGRRTSKTIGSATTSFLYDGLNAVQEVQGSTTTTLLTGLGIDERFARDDAAYGRTYFLADALGSTVGLTDGSQVVRQSYSYEAYGEVSATGGSDNPYQYTGRENDSAGLYYYRARYYSAALRRFISEDPKGLSAGLNEYSYVRGSPMQYRDPMGLNPFGDAVTASFCPGMSCVPPGFGQPGWTPPPPKEDCSCLRMPDYYVFGAGIYVFGGTLTVTRYGDVYGGLSFVAPLIPSVEPEGISPSYGWMFTCSVPKRGKLNDFIGGDGSGFDFGPFGIQSSSSGTGFTLGNGGVGVNGGHNWHLANLSNPP